MPLAHLSINTAQAPSSTGYCILGDFLILLFFLLRHGWKGGWGEAVSFPVSCNTAAERDGHSTVSLAQLDTCPLLYLQWGKVCKEEARCTETVRGYFTPPPPSKHKLGYEKEMAVLLSLGTFPKSWYFHMHSRFFEALILHKIIIIYKVIFSAPSYPTKCMSSYYLYTNTVYLVYSYFKDRTLILAVDASVVSL